MRCRWLICVMLLPSLLLSMPGAVSAAASNPPDLRGDDPPSVAREATDATAPTQRLEVARALLDAGEVAAARASALDLVARIESSPNPDPLQLATALDILVECLWRVRGHATEDATLQLAKRAVRTREVAVGVNHESIAASLRNLGIVQEIRGELEVARLSYERALAIQERHHGKQDARVAQLHNDVAIVCSRMGDYAAAIERFRRSLAILEVLPEPDELEVAFVLNGLGIASMEFGDYASARTCHERALSIRTRILGPEHHKTAQSLNNLAVLLARMGDNATALELFERVLAIRVENYDGDHRLVARARNNVARLRLARGDHRSALELYMAALESFPPDSRDPARGACLQGLGVLHHEVGRLDAAATYLERAAEFRERVRGSDHHYLGETLQRLATLRFEQGNLDLSRSLCERALAIREGLGPHHPKVAESLVLLASVLAESGDPDAAFGSALRAERIASAHLELTSRALSEREALLYASTRARGLDLLLTLAAEGRPAERVRDTWDALMQARALVLDEMATRSRSAALAADPEVKRLIAELRQSSSRLAHLTLHRPPGADAERYLELLRGARREKEAAERALARESLVFRRRLQGSSIGVAEVAASLPADGALVAFAVYERRVRATPQRKASPRSIPHLVAFILTSGSSHPVTIPLGRMDRVDRRIADWGREAAFGVMAADRSSAQTEAAYRDVGSALRRLVWDPLRRALPPESRVFIVPDGTLHRVNFAALPAESGGYLVESGWTFHNLSAERDLVPEPANASTGAGLLALGGADFEVAHLGEVSAAAHGLVEPGAQHDPAPMRLRGGRPPCADTMRFDPLPETAREVREIVGLWRDTKAVTGQSALALTGEWATDTAFKTHAPGRRILHMATHGFFIDGSCVSTHAGTRGIRRTRPAPVVRPNPLLLSGLALAGANRSEAGDAGLDDGILTATEIAALDLQGVEWAVLSACDTGVGAVQAGEGVLGLRRAFEVAGARAVIMSLWAVADQPTREWMRELYLARLVRGRGTADAVRDASLRTLQMRRARGESTHPFFWASFVGAGDWR
jgi:CHAT domain-containing protein/tetratricopeptide (TPR) repeat protein